MQFDSQSTWMNNSVRVRNHGELKSNMAGQTVLLISVIVILLCSYSTATQSSHWHLPFHKCGHTLLDLSKCAHVRLHDWCSWGGAASPSISAALHLSDTQIRLSNEPAFITCHLMLTAVSVLFTWKQGIAMVRTGWIPGVYECLLVPGPLDVALRSGEGGGCAMATWL